MYFDMVEEGLEALRKDFLGYEFPLKEFISEAIRTAKPETQAAFLADRLLFCMAEANRRAEKQMKQFWNWMHGITYFLLTKCNSEDRTIAGIIKLFELPVETRAVLFDIGKEVEVWAGLRTDPTSPCAVEELEWMFSQLLPNRFQTEKMALLDHYLGNK